VLGWRASKCCTLRGASCGVVLRRGWSLVGFGVALLCGL